MKYLREEITDKQIREAFGHDGKNCRVRIRRTENGRPIPGGGIVERFGSPDPFDRSMDFWAFEGYRDDVVTEIWAEEAIRED